MKIIVIGAGGTGSFFLSHLARFIKGHELNHTVDVFDGDSYEHEGNFLRAPIVAAVDRGRNKAEVLCHRLNLLYVLKSFDPRNRYFDPMVDLQWDLLVTCVDSVGFRQELARVVEKRESLWWCDMGNGQDYGQALMGSCAEDWPSAQWPGFWEEKMPRALRVAFRRSIYKVPW